jgi:hypothetical protein
MAQDLKIEIRNLFALHEATIRLEHGCKEAGCIEDGWRVFLPTRFIYAFFTFNGIYGFDWQSSFDSRKAIRWQPDEDGKLPKEKTQFKNYLRYVNDKLSPETPTFFSDKLKDMLRSFRIAEPATVIEHIDLVNASNELIELGKQFPKQFSIVLEGKQKPEDFYPSACLLLKFVYKVRCNLFHGEKTRVQLLHLEQQQRLLIYTALLIAANSLLFRVAEKADIGWEKPSVQFR